MTPYERLLAETIPVRPAPPAPRPRPVPAGQWTAEEQAEHLRTLLDALNGWHWEDDTRLSEERRHLRSLRQADTA